MNSSDDDTHDNGSDNGSSGRETASLIAMLWFVADRVRELGYEQSAKVIEDARATFAEEASKSE